MNLAKEVEAETSRYWDEIRETEGKNQLKVVEAFVRHKVDHECFSVGSGYGYGDVGREKLECIFADIFKAESAIVRPQLVCGTHAISACLFALLGDGDLLISAVGMPYDTLMMAIGKPDRERTGPGSRRARCERSLTGRGVDFLIIETAPTGGPDVQRLGEVLRASRRSGRRTLVIIQRSRGYSERRSLSVNEIGDIVRAAKSADPEIVCMVDNCYGEFVEEVEPSEVGADLVVGSLIKNPGGGLASGGGYIVGRTALIEEIAAHLIAPGLGRRVGTLLGTGRELYQGIFLAPHVVAESLRGAIFCAALMKRLGFKVSPEVEEHRSDIIQVVYLENSARLKAFCAGIQKAGPVGSHLIPEPAFMPGYSDPILMAGGSFVQGSSIELSADAPLKPPYCVYIQGGLTYQHAKIGVLLAAQELIEFGHNDKGGSGCPLTKREWM